MTVYSVHNNVSFGARPIYKRDLPKIKNAIEQTFPIIEIPSKFNPKTKIDHLIYEDMIEKLLCLRSVLDENFETGKTSSYFSDLLYLIKSLRVANCGEIAELVKTSLKMNGIKNCDIFNLYAQKNNSTSQPRNLDHVIAVINVSKSKNNKHTRKLFEPSPKTKVIDLWLGKNIKTIKDIKQNAEELGIQKDEKILLQPIATLEPDKKTIENLKKQFPTLLIKN